jgi:hypothetical protein
LERESSLIGLDGVRLALHILIFDFRRSMIITYGQFIDVVEEIEIVEAQTFIRQWKKKATPEQWEEYREMPLTFELVADFMQDTEGMAFKNVQNLNAYVNTVFAKAEEFGVVRRLGPVNNIEEETIIERDPVGQSRQGFLRLI